MTLSEGKMFTIEALNRIEGFVWPEFANYASMCNGSSYIMFWGNEPINNGNMFIGSGLVTSLDSNVDHYKWAESLITREEFESVDGWVRNTTLKLPPELIDSQIEVLHHNGEIAFDDANAFYWGENVDRWRYRKPQKQEVKPDPESNDRDQSGSQEGIESLISKHKAVKEIARLARIELERVEAAEHSLMLSIEAWAESHGFDIRVLSEGDEKPELLITDWRDLQVGDVVEVREMAVVDGFIGCVGLVKRININAEHGPLLVKFDNGEEWWVKKWKFICRPEKK